MKKFLGVCCFAGVSIWLYAEMPSSPPTTVAHDPRDNSAMIAPSDMRSAAIPVLQGTSYDIPKSEDVDHLVAEVYDEPLGLGTADVAPFVVDPEYVSALLRHFREYVIDDKPDLTLNEIGSIKITSKQGRVSHIVFYDSRGKLPMRFSYRGVRLIRAPTERHATTGLDEARGVWFMISFISRKGKEKGDALKADR